VWSGSDGHTGQPWVGHQYVIWRSGPGHLPGRPYLVFRFESPGRPSRRFSGVDAGERVQGIIESDEVDGWVLAHDGGFVQWDVLHAAPRDALQEFLGGSNQNGSPNFAYGPDGTFRGQNRQAARTGQLSLQFEF
jgi:hypothetical protein